MAENHDDKATVVAVLAGDRQRFAHFVRRYYGPLLHLATNRLGNESLAEDAVQDAFICAFRSLHTYKPEYSFRTWLWTILLNQCRRHGSRNTKRAILSESLDDNLDAAGNNANRTTPEIEAMTSERAKLLSGLLNEIPEVQADAIRLRFFGQLKFREIADTMSSSLGAAKQRVKNGLLGIGELLRERDLVDSVFPEDKT